MPAPDKPVNQSVRAGGTSGRDEGMGRWEAESKSSAPFWLTAGAWLGKTAQVSVENKQIGSIYETNYPEFSALFPTS